MLKDENRKLREDEVLGKAFLKKGLLSETRDTEHKVVTCLWTVGKEQRSRGNSTCKDSMKKSLI